MLIPEYTITSQTLKNIAQIEYGKAVIENTTILENWQNQLKNDAKVRAIHASLEMAGYSVVQDTIKMRVDEIKSKKVQEIENFVEAFDYAEQLIKSKELEDDTFKKLHLIISTKMLPPNESGKFRNKKTKHGVNPEEILAKTVELIDWYHTLDAKETHPVLQAGILKANIEQIEPFSKLNRATADFVAQIALANAGYAFKQYIAPQTYYKGTQSLYFEAQSSIRTNDGDLTDWLEYFSEAIASETNKVKDQVLLLARDTKIAKASGRVELTDRQERIVVYLQDFGILQNKDFPRLFPDLSEDSVLRDLKVLMDKEIVVKKGKTKSSRYELK